MKNTYTEINTEPGTTELYYISTEGETSHVNLNTANIQIISENYIKYCISYSFLHMQDTFEYFFKIENNIRLLHNNGKPAVILHNNKEKLIEQYFYNGLFHNTEGPAIIHYKDNIETHKKYYIMGKKYDKINWFLEKAKLL